MLKKLADAIYDLKITRELKKVEFDDVMFQGKLPFPLFMEVSKNKLFRSPFTPETEKTFLLAVSKLKIEFFENISMEEFKLKMKKVCEYYNFNESVLKKCLEIYEQKTGISLEESDSL